MEELLAVMAVAWAVFYCSFGTFRAFVARRSSWLGRPYLAWFLRDAAAVNGRKRGVPSPLSYRNPAGGRPERGRAGCRTHTVRMQNADQVQSGLWPVVLGLSANARQALPFAPLSKVRQGLGVAGAPSARHNLLKFGHETCKRRDGGADLMV